MRILMGPVGLDKCAGVLEVRRGYLWVLNENIRVQNGHYCSGGSDVFGT